MYSKNDLHSFERSVQKFDRKLENLIKNESDAIGSKINEIKRRMVNRDQRIQKIKEGMNMADNHIYADFCLRIGVANIWQSKKRELVVQHKRALKRFEFEAGSTTIWSLSYKKRKYTQTNIERWKHTAQDDVDSLETFMQAKRRHL